MKLNAKQLRKLVTKGSSLRGQRNEIYIVLDNVLDTYNIGSIFRLADAVAAKKIYLCGDSETPPNHRIKKASINTTEVVEWEYAESVLQAIHKLKVKSKKLKIIAIEQASGAIQYDKFEYKIPICLVVGHETNGISKEVLQSRMLDGIVEIPMFGINKSLNVMASLAIILYEVLKSGHNGK